MLQHNEVNVHQQLPSGEISETEQGIHLDDLPIGAAVNVETGHHTYHVENLGGGRAVIQGHPRFCPEPLVVDLIGSARSGALPKVGFLGIGMRMAFLHPSFGMISTSRIVSTREPALT